MNTPESHRKPVPCHERVDWQMCVFGLNSAGQLGLGTLQTHWMPLVLDEPNNAIATAAGGDHTVILDTNGTVWAFGNNEHCQLSLQPSKAHQFPRPVIVSSLRDIQFIAAGGAHTFAIDEHARVWAFGHNSHGQLGVGDTVDRRVPCKIPSLPAIQFIAAGGNHSLFIDTQNQVWSCGYNFAGQVRSFQMNPLVFCSGD